MMHPMLLRISDASFVVSPPEGARRGEILEGKPGIVLLPDAVKHRVRAVEVLVPWPSVYSHVPQHGFALNLKGFDSGEKYAPYFLLVARTD